jgi:hypothetical protein
MGHRLTRIRHRFDFRLDPPLPAHTRVVAFGSFALHCLILAAPLIAALMAGDAPPLEPPSIAVSRIEVPQIEEAFAIDDPVPPEELSGYEMSGLPFNMPKIAARRKSLFPFLTSDLDFIAHIPEQVLESARQLRNPLAAAASALPPLTLTATATQQLVDESFARRDRWQRFRTVATLLTHHDAQRGQAADLMRAYLDQNLLQPYCYGKTRDGQYWALLENAADHADFLEFIRGYARTHPASRTTTELLFLMDELAQASREAAVGVLTTEVSRDLLRTAVESPPAARLAAEVAQHLRGWLAAHQLGVAEVRLAFDRVRLRLLATIVETSPDGYRAADARYLAGEIFFRQGDVSQAVEWWQAMRPRAGDGYATLAMRDAVKAADVYAIQRVLSREHARWSAINYQRLRQFGYRCDTY